MLYIECVSVKGCTTLALEGLYYGFLTGGGGVYVSRFPREGSHMGAYQLSRFDVLTEEDFIAKKEAKAAKPVSLRNQLNEQEIVEPIEEVTIVESINEEESIVVPGASIEELAIAPIKPAFVSSDTIEVNQYAYKTAASGRVYRVYGFINRIGKAVLYKDAQLLELIGAALASHVTLEKSLNRSVDAKDYPVFIKAILLGDLEGVKVIRNEPSIVVNSGIKDGKICSAEVPLIDVAEVDTYVDLDEIFGEAVEIKQPEVVEELSDVTEETSEESFEQLTIFDF